MTDNPGSILGRPINGFGEKSYRSNVEQWDAEKFIKVLDELLDTPSVEAVKWTQYTPYFNDGEPCEFSVYEAEVHCTPIDGVGPEDDEDEDEYSEDPREFISEYDWRLDGKKGSYVGGSWKEETVPVVYPGVHEALKNFNRVIDHFEDLFLDSFGDHAEVVATKDGFEVHSYEHE